MTDDQKAEIVAKAKGKIKPKPDVSAAPVVKKTPVFVRSQPYGTVHGDPVIRFTQGNNDFDQNGNHIPKS